MSNRGIGEDLFVIDLGTRYFVPLNLEREIYSAKYKCMRIVNNVKSFMKSLSRYVVLKTQ